MSPLGLDCLQLKRTYMSSWYVFGVAYSAPLHYQTNFKRPLDRSEIVSSYDIFNSETRAKPITKFIQKKAVEKLKNKSDSQQSSHLRINKKAGLEQLSKQRIKERMQNT